MSINTTNKDIALYNRIKKGDRIAFNTIFDKYYDSLCDFSYMMNGSKELAEEVVADVLANIWIKKNKIEIVHSLKAYLFRSTRNMTISYMRKRKLNTVHIEDSIHFQPVESSNPEEKIIQEESLIYVENILNIIPEKSRRIFKMHRFDKLKYQEISNILDISNKTVEKHMSKAIKIMREYKATHLLLVLLSFTIIIKIVFSFQKGTFL